METQLTLYQPQTFDEIQAVGKVLAGSGYFNDAKGPAQAVAKIMAGQELGIPAMASLTGIYFFDGKITIGANIMAQLVKRHPKYDYRVIHLTETSCEIAFFERVGAGREELGKSAFTIEDARRASLTSKANWTRYPKNMLFSRAISNGIKWYCPDVSSSGPLYTPDEMGYAVDDNGELVIDGNYRPVQDHDDHQADHTPEITIEEPPAPETTQEPPAKPRGHMKTEDTRPDNRKPLTGEPRHPRPLTDPEKRSVKAYAKMRKITDAQLLDALEVDTLEGFVSFDPDLLAKEMIDLYSKGLESGNPEATPADAEQPALLGVDEADTTPTNYDEGA